MNEDITFVVVFLSLIVAACIVAWVCTYGPKLVIHEHIHKYKLSKDYNRLWDLMMGQAFNGTVDSVAIIDKSSTVFRYGTATKSPEHIWLGSEKFPIKEKGKKEFIALCTYKDIEFLDLTDEIEENS